MKRRSRNSKTDLESYINLVAPDEAPLSCSLEEDPEHNCFKLICRHALQRHRAAYRH